MVLFAGSSVVVDVGGSTMRIAGRVLVKVMVVVKVLVVVITVVSVAVAVVVTTVVLMIVCGFADVLLTPIVVLACDTLSDGGTKGHATPWALQHHFFCSPDQLSAFSNLLQSKHPTFSLRQHHDFFGADHS